MARRPRTPSPAADVVELPAAEELERLKLSPEVAWYLLSRGIPLPDCPPLIKTPEPGETCPGARFDPERVDRVLTAFGLLRHTKGKWAGQPLKPDPWQVAYILAPVFGWIRLDEDLGRWVRVIRELYVDIPRKNGKALDVETPILTAGGWSTMGRLKVGDEVHAADGSLTRVVGVSEVFYGHDCFRVTFADGQSIVANAEHLWTVFDRGLERETTEKTAVLAGRVHMGARGDRRLRVSVPAVLERPAAELPVDPYVLGAWLGDGHTKAGRITTADPEMVDAFTSAGYRVRRVNQFSWGIYGLQSQLRALGVFGNKHAPDAYLQGSASQRLDLLRGLMDTDGTVILGSGTPRCEFTSTRRELADAVLFLARSLGWKATLKTGRATMAGRDCGEKYRVSFNAYADRSPFRLARKTDRLAANPGRSTRSRTNAIVSIEPVATRPTRCIEVAHPSSLYLAGPGLVPTHNSTTLGGIAIYMTAADGEAGAEVLAAATTTEQAGFVFAPVKALVENAPALKPHLKAFAKRIVHPTSASYFQAISSVADAQHGANIHCAVIDELHVHKTADMVEVLETGTGSRDQPLVATITTADDGKPGTIYARKRKRIEQLASRVITDPTVFGVVWAAEKDDDPFAEETQRKANPGFGVSPTRSYLAKEAAKAKDSPADLAKYLRLHLGIRTKQDTRYLELGPWDTSAGMVDELKLAGRPCHGGLDLASVNDITALCWDFPGDDDRHELLWRFWLPEDRLEDLNRRTAGEAEVWVRNGFLRTTPGNVIDNDFIVATILKDAGTFQVRTIGFDRWGATDVVRRLGEEGLTCVPVGQGFASTSAPLKEILRLVLTGRYVHGGNPVMRWMVDNLAVRMDPAGNVKPDKDRSAEKIDGVSAAVVAMREYMDATEDEEEGLPPLVFGV